MAIRNRGKAVRVDRSLVAVPRYKIQRRGPRRHMARDVGKGLFYIALVGGIVALLANLDDLKNSKEAKDHWWLVPVGALVVGYLLKKRGHPYAAAVIAVGGALFALAYSQQSKAQAQAQAQPAQKVPPLPPAPKGAPQPFAPQPKGAETGSPFGGRGSVNMFPSPDGGLLIQAPDGQFVRISRAELGPVNQFANRVMNAPQFRRVA